MYTAEDFTEAFEDYVRFNRELLDGISPLNSIAGVLGLGKRPGNDPGHQKFLNEMGTALKQVISDNPATDTADEIMDVIFGARKKYGEEKISPYLFAAVEGMTLELIPYISVPKAREIYEEYKKLPRSLRVPVMKQVLAALKNKQ